MEMGFGVLRPAAFGGCKVRATEGGVETDAYPPSDAVEGFLEEYRRLHEIIFLVGPFNGSAGYSLGIRRVRPVGLSKVWIP
jgi:hypothetical protein